MGWGIEEVFDRFMVGGGYDHSNGEGSATAKASAAALFVVEEKVWDGYNDVSGRSLFTLAGLEGTCSGNGHCRLGAELGLGIVPGVLGAFAGLKVGASHDFGDGHKKAHVGFELAVLDPISPAVEMWSLEGRVTMDAADRSIGFGLFLSVGGSVKAAVSHN